MRRGFAPDAAIPEGFPLFRTSSPAPAPSGNASLGRGLFSGSPSTMEQHCCCKPCPGPSPRQSRHGDALKLNSPFIGSFYKKTQHCARVEGVFLFSQFLPFFSFFFFLNLVLTEQLAQPRRRGEQGLCNTNGVRGCPRHRRRCYLQRT